MHTPRRLAGRGEILDLQALHLGTKLYPGCLELYRGLDREAQQRSLTATWLSVGGRSRPGFSTARDQ
jgi:hypothetical protein